MSPVRLSYFSLSRSPQSSALSTKEQTPAFRLALGVWYLNALESYASALEVSAVAAKNAVNGVVQLLKLKPIKPASVSPSSSQSSSKTEL
jgi:hypothetical protein